MWHVQKCHKLFTYHDAQFVDRENKKHSKTCDHIRFPNHPQQRMRDDCGAELMRKYVSADGERIFLYPYKVYTYQSLKVSLQQLLTRKDILESLKTTRTEELSVCYYDIFDGSIWKSFLDCDKESYFNDRRNLGGIINVDWFQPFENSEHSIGVIYMVLLNLPREIRFKKENVLIVGIIPGPKEPELVINSFLKPLVDELLVFWNGVYPCGKWCRYVLSICSDLCIV